MFSGFIDLVKQVSNLAGKWRMLYSDPSLVDITKITRVEPITIVSKDCMNLPYLQNINASLLNLFSAYYLQAINLLVNINDIKVIKTLSKINPNVDFDPSALESAKITKLSLEHALPGTAVVALEDTKIDIDNRKAIIEDTNLAVGKILNVTIKLKNKWGETKELVIPVSVRLMVNLLPNSSIVSVLAQKTDDIGFIERYHAWKSGRISFWKDLIFCQDLIDDYKRIAIKDPSEVINKIQAKASRNRLVSALNNNPSLVMSSNLFVITEENARELEAKFGGKLTKFDVREKAFENTYAMIIVVVDREYERVRFYTRGIKDYTDLSVKEIKNSSKNNGPDIMDMMKSIVVGNSPSF